MAGLGGLLGSMLGLGVEALAEEDVYEYAPPPPPPAPTPDRQGLELAHIPPAPKAVHQRINIPQFEQLPPGFRPQGV